MSDKVSASMPAMGRWNLEELANPPNIGGRWQALTRFMWDRNAGDGIKYGVKEVDPPDPSAPGGRIIMIITQQGSTYTALSLNAAAHEHPARGFYIGGHQFSCTTIRTNTGDGSEMILSSVATLQSDGTLETMVVSAEGGNAIHRDPPPTYRELRTWRKLTDSHD